jgi:hypothetical protein
METHRHPLRAQALEPTKEKDRMSQPDLFTPVAPRARTSDPATSHAAAKSMLGNPLTCQRAAIMGVLWRPMTIYEIAKLTGLDHVQVARRMPELEEGGHANPTGQEKQGPNGRMCRLWEKSNA